MKRMWTSLASSAWASTPFYGSRSHHRDLRAYGSDKTYQWESSGVDGYTIVEAPQREDVGTDVIMHIKPDKDEEKYQVYLESYYVKHLVKRYSDYIRYPIECLMNKTRAKEKDPNAKEGRTGRLGRLPGVGGPPTP